MTFDEALKATPLIAQFVFMGVGFVIGLVPIIFIWGNVENYKSEARLAKKILKIKEEYIQQLQASSQEERTRFQKFAIRLLDIPTTPTDTRLN